MPMIAAAAAVVVAGGVQAYSQYQQGQMAEAVAKYNADVSEMEAQQADMEAREEIARMRARNKELLSERRADIGASGVVGFSGSPLAVLGEEAGRLELQALDTARASELNLRRGYSQGRLSRMEGAAASKGATLQAGATFLSSVGRAYGAMRGG